FVQGRCAKRYCLDQQEWASRADRGQQLTDHARRLAASPVGLRNLLPRCRVGQVRLFGFSNPGVEPVAFVISPPTVTSARTVPSLVSEHATGATGCPDHGTDFVRLGPCVPAD